ncbi:hypothetical protein COP1_014630 [Malus domestica]
MSAIKTANTVPATVFTITGLFPYFILSKVRITSFLRWFLNQKVKISSISLKITVYSSCKIFTPNFENKMQKKSAGGVNGVVITLAGGRRTYCRTWIFWRNKGNEGNLGRGNIWACLDIGIGKD